jgi:hypothetical protein
MATKKAATPTDEKLDSQDFVLFDALKALDRKDYSYYDNLTPEQQKKFVPYMMLLWMSAIKGAEGVQRYYVMSVNEYANKHFFSEHIQKHPKLQWLMLCASSPGLGSQFHQWIPNIKDKVSKLQEPAKLKDIKEYYTKIYPKASSSDVQQVSEAFVTEQKKKHYLATKYPNMKFEDIQLLSNLVTDEDINEYERESGN